MRILPRLCGPLALLGAVLVAAGEPPARTVTGLTEPFLDLTLSTQVGGTVKVRHFKEGDFVQAGQTLLELDKQLEELAVERRKAVAETLKASFEATRRVHQTTKSVSKEDLDKAEMEYRVAAVDWEIAREQLRRRSFVAPSDGTVCEHYFEVGEDCKPQEAILRMADVRKCYFVANLEPRLVQELRPGQNVALEIDTGGAPVQVEGRIVFVSPLTDPASGLVKLKALFENPQGRVRPGAAGRLRLSEPSPHAP